MTIAKNTKRTCRHCKTSFNGAPFQTYCSPKCYNESRSKYKDLKCKRCGKNFKGISYNSFTRTYCSDECWYDSMSELRKGRNNPNYRNGKSKVTHRGRGHRNACRKYKESFIEKHGYTFCEVCGVNINGTMRFEVHHIYFASLYPQHPNLHDPRNLVLICIDCHNKFHAGKEYEKEFRKLEKERGLKKLFTPSSKYGEEEI